MKKLLFFIMSCYTILAFAVVDKIDIDGRKSGVNLEITETKQSCYAPWLKEDIRKRYAIFSSPVTNEWTKKTIEFTPDKSGAVTLSIRGGAVSKDSVQWIAYKNLKITGIENKVGFQKSKFRTKDNELKAGHDFPEYKILKVIANQKVTISFEARLDKCELKADMNKNKVVKPVAKAKVLTLPKGKKLWDKIDIDGRRNAIALDIVEVNQNSYAPWLKEDIRKRYAIFSSPVTNEWTKKTIEFTPQKTGSITLVIRGGAISKDVVQWIAYKNFEITGIENKVGFQFSKFRTADNELKAGHDFPEYKTLKVIANQKVTISFESKIDKLEKKSDVKATKAINLKKKTNKIGIDGRPDAVSFKINETADFKFPAWLKDKDKNKYAELSSPISKNWTKTTIKFTPLESGQVGLSFRGGASAEKDKIQWVAYKNIKITGIISKVDFSFPQYKNAENQLKASYYLSDSRPIQVLANQEVTISFESRIDELEKPTKSYIIPRAKVAQHEPSYYRYYDKQVKLLPLKDKGVKPEDIKLLVTEENPIPPTAKFNSEIKEKVSTVTKDSFQVEFLEEDNISREATLSFGFPVAVKTLWNLNNIQMLNSKGKVVPIQCSTTSFWPDGSIKTVLVNFFDKLNANDSNKYTVEFGSSINSKKIKSPFKVKYKNNVLTINNSLMTSKIDANNFCLAGTININKEKFNFKPLIVVDENGKIHASNETRLTNLQIIDSGLNRLIVRADGQYGKDKIATFRVQITFYAKSPEIKVAITHYNTNLKSEFTDITSLGFELENSGSITLDGKKQNKVFIADEKSKSLGIGKVGNVTFATIEARERFPKSVEKVDSGIYFGILPKQPNAKFGKNLPHYLQFPFCEGFYRSKWGMGFTQEYIFDFSGNKPPNQLVAPVAIAVIERDYLAKTKVFPGVLPSSEKRFDVWDKNALNSLNSLMATKTKQREYGYFNYGDWFGERGRNWGNNEYDTAHGLFMLYLRTGSRLAYKQALLAAQHQADTDIVHAYVDPYYVGANAEHSIGHTGVSYQAIRPASWSLQFEHSFLGVNGHTWAGGMTDAWLLAGDNRVMDSAMLLGEHLSNHIAPNFFTLSSQERTGGWSSIALLSLYRATSDPKYLNAAKKILQVAFNTQNFEWGGAWPHKLYSGHDGGFKKTFGNTAFLIGVIGEAIREYYALTNDPQAKESLINLSRWLFNTYNKEAVAWPYTSSWDAKPYFEPSRRLNLLIAPPMLTGGELGQNSEILLASKNIISDAMINGVPRIAKTISYELYSMPNLIDSFITLEKSIPKVPTYEYNATVFINYVAKHSVPQYRTRGPFYKEFAIKLLSPSAKLHIYRKKHGSGNSKVELNKIQILDAKNNIVKEEKLELNKPYDLTINLSGNIGDTFTIKINDDMSSIWFIDNSKDFKSYSKVFPKTTFATKGYAKFFFTVPAKVKSFSVVGEGIHTGNFSLWLIDPNGKIYSASGFNSGIIRLPWLKNNNNYKKANITVKRNLSKFDEKWILLFIGYGDVGISISGVPPYLSVRP